MIPNNCPYFYHFLSTVESFKFVDYGIFAYLRDVISRLCWFSVLVRKLTLSKFVLVEDVNSQGRATYEYMYHQNWATTKSNDSTYSKIICRGFFIICNIPIFMDFLWSWYKKLNDHGCAIFNNTLNWLNNCPQIFIRNLWNPDFPQLLKIDTHEL